MMEQSLLVLIEMSIMVSYLLVVRTKLLGDTTDRTWAKAFASNGYIK